MPLTNCPVCQGTDLKLWTSATDIEYFSVPDYYKYYECQQCRLLQIDPVPEDKLSVIYPTNYYSFTSQKKSMVSNIKEWLDKRLFNKIISRLKGNIKALDIGGGSGWLLNTLRAVSDRVTFTQVVDIDPGSQALAKANGHEYFLGRVEEFETTQQFDFILMLNLIEHVADPLAVLKKSQQLLSGQGVILIKTPNYLSLDADLFRNHNWGGLHCPRHWVIFSEKSFRLIADKANLKIDSLTFTQGAPFWTVSILAWLNKKGIISLSSQRPSHTHPLYSPLMGLFGGIDLLRKPFGKTSQMFIVLSKK